MLAAKVRWDRKLKLQQSCRLCRRSDFRDTRKVWGCDAPAPTPTLTVDCWMCSPRPDPNCRTCGGAGKLHHHRCPRNSIPHAAAQACELADMALDLGVLPRAGGWQDQHPSFHEALMVVAGERNRYLFAQPDEEERTTNEVRVDPAPAIDPHGYLRTPNG